MKSKVASEDLHRMMDKSLVLTIYSFYDAVYVPYVCGAVSDVKAQQPTA